ncbi:MAG TPA: hypothetical protein VNZ23_12555 [Xanthobacteraceae bacterium]|nr:hypothetical protein [Xanthobacteraceae bacterium]
MHTIRRHGYPSAMDIGPQCCRSVIDERNPNGRNPDFAGSFSFGGYPAGAVATRRPFERATMMSAAPEASSRNDRYFLVLGAAALDLWGHLPQALQESLFERAVVLGHKSERDKACGSNWRNSCTTTILEPLAKA